MVEVWELRDVDAGAKKVGRVEMVEGDVILTMGNRIADFLSNFRCISNGIVYSITDGEPWVEALPANLRGSRLWAESADG